MQNVISANMRSITETQATVDPLIPTYKMSKAMPPLGKQLQSISPYITFSGAAAGNSMTFKFPPGAGFMYDASLGFTCTNTVASADLLTRPGFDIINQIDYLCNGQPVLTYTGRALKAICKCLPVAEQIYINKYSYPLKPATELIAANGDSSFLTYTPLPASFLSTVEKCLLLNVIGDFQLRVSFATQAESGLTNPITAVTGVLYVETYMPKLSVYNQMVLNDWSKTLAMEETWNTYTEVVPMSSSTGVSNYSITCPFLAFRIHLMVHGVAGVSATFGVVPINSVTLNIAGVPYITALKPSRFMTQKAKNGIASLELSAANPGIVGYDSEQIATIDFGVESTRSKNTGTAFLQELRGSTLSVTCDSVTANDCRLFVITEYWNTLSYTPGAGGSSGMLSITQNN